MSKKMKRREFMIKSPSIVIGAGLALKSGLSLGTGESSKSKIVEVIHSKAVLNDRKVDTDIVRKMLKEGIKTLTGAEKPWAQFVKPGDRVGLKINTLGRPLLYTHHELIKVVAEELMDFGIKENNIIIWDRWESQMRDCDFVINTSDKGVRCYGTQTRDKTLSRHDKEKVFKSDFDNSRQREEGRTESYFSRIFTQECDKVINMAILKDHGLAAVTLCLKNLAYGLCDNNRRFHGPKHIGPFISEFCAIPQVRDKVVLHMIDGLEACYDQGPCPRNPKVIYPQNTLWIGTDPVALDTVGFNVINAKRKEIGIPPLEESGRPTDHIKLSDKKGLGISNLKQIEVQRITLG